MDKLLDRLSKLSPEKRALLEGELEKRDSGTSAHLTIARRKSDVPAPLSFAQQRLWFLNRLEPESPAYNEPKAIRLQGELNKEAVEKALNALVDRHEILRTTFPADDGGTPMQLVGSSRPVALCTIDLSESPENARDEELQRAIVKLTERPFDLSRDLMLRTALIRLAERDHALVLITHHIVSDGWSVSNLWSDFAALYGAFSQGQSNPLADLPIQYSDYAEWQRQSLQGEHLERLLAYWKTHLDGVSTLQLPTDRPRPVVQSYRGAQQHLSLAEDLSEGLRTLSREQGVTLFMTLLAAFQALIYRYTGQEDFAIGSPIAGRTRAETEGLAGFFVNTLVLRATLVGKPTFRDLLTRVREVAFAAYDHQDLPFEKLVEEINPERNLSQNPVFQVMFAFQNVPTREPEFPALTVRTLEINRPIAKFDLFLSMRQEAEGLRGSLQYNTDLFDAATITRMLGHFETLLQGIVTNPDQPVSDLPILTETEKHQLLVEWNDTQRDYPQNMCIHELFEAQVERTPDAVAAVFEDKQLTYRELNRRANQLGHYLQKLGVGADVLVAICIERSLEMVIGLLGILKAGGAYVPLDPTCPKEWLTFMLEDAQVSVVLTEERFRKELLGQKAEVICIDSDWEQIAQESNQRLRSGDSPDSLAYVMYTSGSTGRPKGVAVCHRGVLRLLFGIDYVELDSQQSILQMSPISFDASTFELWAALLHGARCVLFPDRVPTVESLGTALRKHSIRSLWLTASLYNVVIDEAPEILSGLQQLLIGGEALSVDHVRRGLDFLPSTQIINGYGPTENTTFTCCYRIPPQLKKFGRSIPIGRPIGNTEVYLLDRNLQLVPIGIPGELFIGGAGLARGYLNRPELTAERFITNPFSDEPGARLYKTGDLARYLPDGSIEFLGRLDHQVKVRGFRIELGEIETMLGQYLAVRQAVVMAREDVPSEKRLVAYVIANQESTTTTNELRSFLKEKLPDYMIPSAFVMLESLPLSPNGKIDRLALPAPDQARPELGETFVAPRTPIEEALASIWSKILSVEQVGLDDDFFELGGHSLLVAKLIAQIKRDLQVNLPLRFLFESPTIAQLAARIKATQDEGFHLQEEKGTCSYLVKLQSGQSQTLVFCFPYIGGFRGDFLSFARLARLIGPDYSFYGLQARGTDGVSQPHRRVEDMAADYIEAMQTLQPHGPYFLIGECAGAPVAYETARQLWARGEKVAGLAFLDSKYSGQSLARYLWRRLSARLRYRFHPISELWARAAFPLREIQRLERGKRLRYFFDKMGKAIVVISYVLRGERPLHRQWANIDGGDTERQKSKHVERAQKAYVLAIRRYKRRPYQGRITLLVNEEWYRSDPNLRRFDLANRGVEVHTIPGNHLTYITDNIQIVAKELRECLDRASLGQNGGNKQKVASFPDIQTDKRGRVEPVRPYFP